MMKMNKKRIIVIISTILLLVLALIGSVFYQIYQLNKAVSEHNVSKVKKIITGPYGDRLINLPDLTSDSFNDALGDVPQYPLQVAVHNADYEMVKLLVESGANINVSSADSPPVICYGLEAYKKGTYKCIKYLIDNGAINDFSNAYFEMQETTLSISAAMFGEDKILTEMITDDEIEKEGLKTYKLIVSNDELRNDKDAIYEFSEAISYNHYYIVEEILKTHPDMDLNQKLTDRAQVINDLNQYICNEDTCKIAELLIKNGADTKCLLLSKEEYEEDMSDNDIPKERREKFLGILFGN